MRCTHVVHRFLVQSRRLPYGTFRLGSPHSFRCFVLGYDTSSPARNSSPVPPGGMNEPGTGFTPASTMTRPSVSLPPGVGSNGLPQPSNGDINRIDRSHTTITPLGHPDEHKHDDDPCTFFCFQVLVHEILNLRKKIPEVRYFSPRSDFTRICAKSRFFQGHKHFSQHSPSTNPESTFGPREFPRSLLFLP